jgi:hypothetical protein
MLSVILIPSDVLGLRRSTKWGKFVLVELILLISILWIGAGMLATFSLSSDFTLVTFNTFRSETLGVAFFEGGLIGFIGFY